MHEAPGEVLWDHSGDYVAYAGFWRRFIAFSIDVFVLMIVFYALDSISGSTVLEFGEDGSSFRLLGLLIYWLYFALMESSSAQATLGKMALGLVVTDLEGGRISFLRATGRHFGKVLSYMLFSIGFLMAGFTARKQALHDMISGCLVVRK
ncbi:RDD family protein [bacterium]|nr:RDD family protein [bacterium]